jgi:queuine tRNA-ribosyltransferase
VFEFRLDATQGAARAGTLTLPHGELRTPAFMPVGTHGVVRGLSPGDVARTGAQIMLANTYHLHLRPGEDVIRAMGGLHRFTTWPGPMLTDSGGFQVFSLEGLRRISEQGVEFQSHVDGTYRTLTPERAVEIQWALGADVAMVFDHVVPGQAPFELALEGMERTLRWLDRCKARHAELVERHAEGGGLAVPNPLAHPPGRHPRRAPPPLARGHPRARPLDRDRHRRPLRG